MISKNNFYFIVDTNEGKYELKASENEVIVDYAKPKEHVESKELEEKNFAIARDIETNPGEIYIKQRLYTAPNISSGGIKIREVENAVLLNADKNDVEAYQNYISLTKEKVDFNQFGDNSVQIDGDRGHFYLKMHNSDAYVVGRWGLKEKLLPIINQTSHSPHIALSSNGLIYYDLKLMSKADFMTNFMQDRWMMINEDGDVAIVKHGLLNGHPLLTNSMVILGKYNLMKGNYSSNPTIQWPMNPLRGPWKIHRLRRLENTSKVERLTCFC